MRAVGIQPKRDKSAPMYELREYRYPAMMALAFIVLGSIPYCYAHLHAGPDMEFMSVLRDTEGGNMYFMWLRQAEDGKFLFDSLYTPEQFPAKYILLEWWLLGSLARVTGLSQTAVFHVGRVLSVVAFMFSLYFLIVQCLDTLFRRRFAFALVCLCAGFGWIPWLAAQVYPFAYPWQRDIDGITMLGTLITKPHFTRAYTLVILLYACVLAGERTGKRRWFVLSGLCAFLHLNMRPYGIPETYLFYFLFPALLCLKERRFNRARFINYGIAALVPLPMVLYYVYMFYRGPLGPSWSQVATNPPRLLADIIWLGLPFLLCIIFFEGFSRLRHMKPSTILLVLWVLLAFVLQQTEPYLKGTFETVYGLLVVPPILITGGPLRRIYKSLSRTAVFSRTVPEHWSPERRKYVAAVLFIGFCSLSNIAFVGTLFTRLTDRPYPYYLSTNVCESMRWLDEHADCRDTILATHPMGQYIPRLTGARAFTGHFVLTINFSEKNRLVERFYGTRGDDAFKRQLVQKYDVRFVLLSPFEKRPNGMVPSDHPWLVRVFARGDVSVYEVTL